MGRTLSPSTKSHHSLVGSVVSLVVFVVGCGPDSGMAPVRGKVTIEGEPLAEAAVGFTSLENNQTAIGKTGPDGSYTLTTRKPGDGALVGEHKVSITAVTLVESPKAKAMKEKHGSLAAEMPLPPPKEEWLAPKKYSDPDTSGLSFTVERGKNEANFDLSE